MYVYTHTRPHTHTHSTYNILDLLNVFEILLGLAQTTTVYGYHASSSTSKQVSSNQSGN